MRPHPRGSSGYIRLARTSRATGVKCGAGGINPGKGGWIVAASKTMSRMILWSPLGIDSSPNSILKSPSNGFRHGGWHEVRHGFSSVSGGPAAGGLPDQKRINPDLRLYFGDNRLNYARIEIGVCLAFGHLSGGVLPPMASYLSAAFRLHPRVIGQMRQKPVADGKGG
jgi:hypothetical protein